MAASSGQNENEEADRSAELGRVAAEMLLKSPFLAMNPTLVPPTAALAAATIIGFGLSTQVAGAFFGALQAALDVANRFAAEHGNAADGQARGTDDARNTARQPQTNGAADSGAMQQPNVEDDAASSQTNGAAFMPKVRRTGSATSVDKANGAVSSVSNGKLKRVVKKPVKADDLKRISGIGPKLEQLLNGLGIRAVAQIAAWTDDDVTRIDAALGVDGRIARDSWVAQAKKLVA